MSLRQGTNVIAGGIQIDNTPLSGSLNAVSSGGVYTALSSKASIDLDNITSAGKAESVSWGRNFTVVDSTVATGNAGIAGIYGLGFTDNKVKIGVFAGAILLATNGFSSIALRSDVMTAETRICGTNNYFRADGTITIPFINEIQISFPETSGGVANGSFIKFIGWM